MKHRLRALVALTAALVGSAGAAASADPIETFFTVTVNALSGSHQVNGGGRDTLSFAPLPLGELTVRRGAETLRVEGLPPVTFGYSSVGSGAQSTRLSIANATFRHAFAGGWFIGAGATIYNQITTYIAVDGQYVYQRGTSYEPIFGSEQQYSRVTGARFELGRVVSRGPNRAEFWAAVNPKMRGIQYTLIPTFSGIVHTYPDPENATQVDVTARVAHQVSKHGEVLLGVRYLNYGAHYDDFPGQLADRNVGFAPVVGYRAKL